MGRRVGQRATESEVKSVSLRANRQRVFEAVDKLVEKRDLHLLSAEN